MADHIEKSLNNLATAKEYTDNIVACSINSDCLKQQGQHTVNEQSL
jgi:hypothetical protein